MILYWLWHLWKPIRRWRDRAYWRGFEAGKIHGRYITPYQAAAAGPTPGQRPPP